MKKHHVKTLFLPALLAAVLFSGCLREDSESVDQDRIFTEYELFYNANEDVTYARATFKFGSALGTKLELTDPSAVSFNGDALTFNGVLAYYEREYAGLVSSGTFEWTDLDGNTFANAIELRPIEYAAGIDTIDRSASYELFWEGEPLAANELVSVTINGENEGDARIWTTNDQGAQSIILTRNRLEQVGQGPGTIWLDRSYLPGLTQATGAGGILNGRYRPVNKQVYMK